MESRELLTKRRIEKISSGYEDLVLSSEEGVLNENKSYEVFVSHSSADKEFIRKVLLFLKYAKGGVNAYVDWQDPNMYHPTNEQTAITIKKRIRRARKVIYVVTNDSLKSVWCSWEIGFADRDKGNSNLAILAIKPNNGYWKNNEYLQQYPWISYIDSQFRVVMPNGKSQLLYEWIHN